MTRVRTLSDRELTVSLLARQLLLERRRMPVVRAVHHLVALQAQYSPSPYIALASRVAGFRQELLEKALIDRRVLKATLMRGTLHLVAAADYPALAAAVHPQLSLGMRGANRVAEGVEQEIVAGLAEFTVVARTSDEIRVKVDELSGGTVKKEWLLDYARTMVPMVHVPPSGLWQRHGKFSLVGWDGPVPVRLLARLDAAVISHKDRSRILPVGYHDEVMKMGRANVMPYLADGLVAGQWSYEVKRDVAVLSVRPFGAVPAGLEEECARMLEFVAPEAGRREISVHSCL